MAITYPLTLPTTIGYNSLSIVPENSVGVSESKFNYKQQVYKNSGQRWVMTCQYPPLKREVAAELKAFLVSLNGPVGTFYAGDFLNSSPLGSVSGTVLVNGAGQSGQVLNVDGIGASLTNAFKAGDWIQIGNYLYMILKNVNSNGSGQASLDIWPALRSSPADNAAVTYSSPKGLWRLTASSGWSANEAGFYDISFEAVEAI